MKFAKAIFVPDFKRKKTVRAQRPDGSFTHHPEHESKERFARLLRTYREASAPRHFPPHSSILGMWFPALSSCWQTCQRKVSCSILSKVMDGVSEERLLLAGFGAKLACCCRYHQASWHRRHEDRPSVPFEEPCKSSAWHRRDDGRILALLR